MSKKLNSLVSKIKKNSDIDIYKVGDSPVYTDVRYVKSEYPALNIAFSGSVNGGMEEGKITIFSGESKHGKTLLSLVAAKGFLDKYPDGILIFYDTEFGAPMSYLAGIGIDTDRVVHIPIQNLEELKNNMVNILDSLDEDDRVMFFWDSISNTPSMKELEDSAEGKNTADMTKARVAKSLFRMITPKLALKKVPLIGIGHVYDSIGSFIPTKVISGGKGLYYGASTIFMMRRRQVKTGGKTTGYEFVIQVEKGRDVKEKSEIIMETDENEGLTKYGGMLEIGLETGFVVKPSNGWYSRVDVETGEVESKKWRARDTQTDEFWEDILKSEEFDKKVQEIYRFFPNQTENVEDKK